MSCVLLCCRIFTFRTIDYFFGWGDSCMHRARGFCLLAADCCWFLNCELVVGLCAAAVCLPGECVCVCRRAPPTDDGRQSRVPFSGVAVRRRRNSRVLFCVCAVCLCGFVLSLCSAVQNVASSGPSWRSRPPGCIALVFASHVSSLDRHTHTHTLSLVCCSF